MGPLKYTIIIEQTDDPQFWGYFSPDLEGYTGCATSWQAAIMQATEGIDEYIGCLREFGLNVPEPDPNACIRFIGPEDADRGVEAFESAKS